MNFDKSNAYKELVNKRKSFNFTDKELTNPSKTKFDIDHIEPWAQWQSNIDATILLIGQEFCDTKTYEDTEAKVEIYPDKYEYTSNKNLYEYFKILGFDLGHPTNPNNTNPIFFTNCVMGLKPPPMSSNFESRWMKESGKEFLLPLIEIIKPKIIITVGSMALKSIGNLLGFKVDLLREMVNKPIEIEGIRVFPVYHPGGLGLRNRPKLDQENDWRNIKSYLDTLKSS